MRLLEFYGLDEEAANPASLGWDRDPRTGNWQRGEMYIARMSGGNADVDGGKDGGSSGWEYCLYAKNKHNQFDLVTYDDNISVVLAKADEIDGQDPEEIFAHRYK
jgi:hypothetical protein